MINQSDQGVQRLKQGLKPIDEDMVLLEEKVNRQWLLQWKFSKKNPFIGNTSCTFKIYMALSCLKLISQATKTNAAWKLEDFGEVSW